MTEEELVSAYRSLDDRERKLAADLDQVRAAKDQLLVELHGCLTTARVGELLGLSRQEVSRRIQRHRAADPATPATRRT